MASIFLKLIIQCSPTLKNQGAPTHPTSKKILLNNFEYYLLSKHVEYYDQQTGARHPRLCNRDVRFMKVCTIILIGMMTLALKVLALFTLSMGALIFESIL